MNLKIVIIAVCFEITIAISVAMVFSGEKPGIPITRTASGRERIEQKHFTLEAESICQGNSAGDYIAAGNIELTTENGTGKADKAFINIKNGKVVLKGNAGVITEKLAVKGKRRREAAFVQEIIVLSFNSQKTDNIEETKLPEKWFIRLH